MAGSLTVLQAAVRTCPLESLALAADHWTCPDPLRLGLLAIPMAVAVPVEEASA